MACRQNLSEQKNSYLKNIFSDITWAKNFWNLMVLKSKNTGGILPNAQSLQKVDIDKILISDKSVHGKNRKNRKIMILSISSPIKMMQKLIYCASSSQEWVDI